MVATNYGKEQNALRWANTGSFPQFCAIGSASGAIAVTNSGLYHETGSRITYTGSPNTGTLRKTSWTFDFSSVRMSGTNLREFGIGAGSQPANDLFNVENFDVVVFDGTNELKVEITLEQF